MRFCVLGSLVVTADDDAPVSLPGAKERLLTAMLAAAAPGTVSVDRLTDVLWAGAPPPTAHKSLQSRVVGLRSALEPDRPKGSPGRYVVRRGAGYALAVGREAIDALYFGDATTRGRALLASGDPVGAERTLAGALELWRGEPYADWPDAPFADVERRRLVEVRAAAVAGLLESRLAQGRGAEVVPDLERLVAQEPLREGWWTLLMLALYRDGRQADALAASRRVRALLAEEVGADPGPALRRMETSILEQDPDLDLPVQRDGSAQPWVGPRPGQEARATCPYMGLAAYQQGDAALFRGRQRVVADLVRGLVGSPLLVVSGPSGAGKSSLVRAGLLPALARGGLPGSAAWQRLVLTPGRDAVDGLAALTGEAPPEAPVVLVADQFEELWAPGVDPAERTAFLDAVLGLLDDGIVVRCVAVVRGDHVGRLAEHAAFTERLGGRVVLVPPMTDPELREVVAEPARTAGLSVESELVDTVVVDVVGQPGALPLLSTALVGTWERRRGTVLTLAGYLAAGGVAGALASSAESAYAALDEAGRGVVPRILVRLADSDEPGVLVRRRVPLRELDLTGEAGTVRREVVEQFVRRRLLAVDGDRLEVAHEALLTAWPRLARWLEDDAVGRAVRKHLAPAALEWDANGRPEEELYRGARLGAALDWAARPDADPSPAERAFVDASQARADAELRNARERADREARARHRTTRLAAGLAAVLVLALVAAGLAVKFQQDADARAREAAAATDVADANRLAALSTTESQLDLSLLLAAQAVRLSETPETQDGLLAALVQHRRAVKVSPMASRPLDLALTGDGRAMFARVSEADPKVQSWPVGDTTDAQLVDDGTPAAIAAAPDGDLVAVAFFAEEPHIGLRTSAGDTVLDVTGFGFGGWPYDIAFTPDGEALLAVLVHPDPPPGVPSGPTLRRLDLATREWQTVVVVDPRAGDYRAAVADDGSAAVVWNRDGEPRATLVDVASASLTPLALADRSASTAIITALPTGAAQLWDDGAVTLYDRSGRAVQTLEVHQGAVRDVLLAPSASWGATAGDDGTIVLWDVDPALGLWSRRETLTGHAGQIVGIELDPTGSVLYSVATDDRMIAWDVTDDAGFGTAYPGLADRWIANRPEPVAGGLLVAPTRPISRTRDGREGIGDPPDTVDVRATFLDPATGTVVAEVPVGLTSPGSTFGSSVSVSPDGARVAVTSALAVTVLDTRTREVLGRYVLPQEPAPGLADGEPSQYVWGSAWTNDGARLLLGTERVGGGGLIVLDAATWQVERLVDLGAGVQRIESSPDGRLLVATSLGAAEVWLLDGATLETVRTVPLADGEQGFDLSFSPDGRMLAVGGFAGAISVFDTATWEPLQAAVHVSSELVQQVDWLPDGRTVLAAAASGEVVLYDALRGQVRGLPLPGSTTLGPGYTHLVPGADDELVVLSGERDGHRYPMRPAQWLADACAIVGERDLTEEEWSRYLPDRPHEPTCSDLG